MDPLVKPVVWQKTVIAEGGDPPPCVTQNPFAIHNPFIVERV
jgi:hypothetical protein